MSTDASRLLRAIAVHTGPVTTLTVQSEPWSSATFTGARHILRFDAMAGPQLDTFCRNLHELEFAMPDGFVADINLVERGVQGPIERIGLDVLTIAMA